jgi:hypothetical protein
VKAAFLEHLTALDVPIFTAPPGGEEFQRPGNWPHTTVTNNFDVIQAWRPGLALCGVMGGRIAAVDVDPRNGGDVDAVRFLLACLEVTIFAEVATPGGGRHFYVAGHPHLATVHAMAGRPGLIGYPGVDVQSFGSNVFLPGTTRPKYHGNGYAVLLDNLEALADGGDPDGAAAFAGWVAEHRTSSSADFTLAAPWDGTPPDTRQSSYLDAVLRDQVEHISAMAPDSGRNNAVYVAALKCGNFVAGAGMDETQVIEQLVGAAHACGLVSDDGIRSVEASIKSGLRNGRQNPRAVPEHVEQAPTICSPIPLDRTDPLPTFPVEALGEPVRSMVGEVAEFTQTDPALAGTVALGVLSACAAGRVKVEVRGSWTEPLCIYCVASISFAAARTGWPQHIADGGILPSGVFLSTALDARCAQGCGQQRCAAAMMSGWQRYLVAPSPCCSRTSRARRCCCHGSVMRMPTRWTASGKYFARRGAITAGRNWALRVTVSTWCSLPRRLRLLLPCKDSVT